MSGVADPFDTLDLEPRFDLDIESLGARHRELSLALHPDRFAGRPASERRAALSKAMDVNAAKRTLDDPVSRAETLLVRLGAAVGEGREPAAPPELLMAMMERREALQAARAASDKTALLRLTAEVEAEQAREIANLGALFAEAFGGRSEARDAIVRSLGALRYYRRFFDEAFAVLDDLD